MRVLAYVIMPNHWHLVVWPERDGELTTYLQWLTVTHVRRWHAHHHTEGTGPLYQGRFKSFPIQEDEHLLKAWRLKRNGQVLFELPRAAVLRSMGLNHVIHHRGQLSVYLRLLDVPLPSVYGPTADEALFS